MDNFLPASGSLTCAEYIVRFLEDRGTTHIAGIPGGALLPLYAALGTSRLVHILARHEQGAGFIAQGIARISGRAGVCLATSGPGVTNVVTALADARADSIPLVCLSGQVPRALIGTDAFQEIPTERLVAPITKAHFSIQHAEDLPDLLAEAFRIAESGRRGPVLVDLPKDLQSEILPAHCLPPRHSRAQDIRPASRAEAAGEEASWARAAAMIDTARRPVLYLGGGVTQARAQEAACMLAEQADLPTTTTLMALGTLPPAHPLNLGMLGMHGARFCNQAIDECDLLIAIGARFDDRATGRADRFAPGAQVIHIDADPRELGKLRQPELGILADAADGLQQLIRRVRPQTRPAWRQRIESLRDAYRPATPGTLDLDTPAGLIHSVARAAGADAIITSDVGQHQMWVAQAYPFTRPERWLTSGGLGTMGFGLPAAIGAALAAPGQTVVCFSGDGSVLMNLQELATLAELGLKVKLVVMDNAALGMVRQQQQLFYQQRFVGSLFTQPPNLCQVAEGFGIPALDLETADDPTTALQRAISQPGPSVIRAPIVATEQVLPMVIPGKANTEVVCG